MIDSDDRWNRRDQQRCRKHINNTSEIELVKLSQAFEKWQFTAAEMAGQQRKLSGAMKRMLNRALSGAFEAWQSNAADSKREGAALAKGLMRLINGKLGAAFEIELVKLSQCV